MTYRLDSDFPFTYAYDLLNRLVEPLGPLEKKRKVPVVWIASNCGASNGRQYYIKELMKYIEIDSYGKCLNNKEYPKDVPTDDIIKEYKFYLAFENSNCKDYVTEKFFRAMAVGVLPIVDGPEDYSAFNPVNRSLIRTNDFNSPKDLARYIKLLDSNDELYKEYFSYKFGKPIDPNFIKLWQTVEQKGGFCGLCEKIHHGWEVGGIRGTAVLEDISCEPPRHLKYKIEESNNNKDTKFINLFSLGIVSIIIMTLLLRYWRKKDNTQDTHE